MLSQYQDLLNKRRLERKMGSHPLPEVPPFQVLTKEKLAELGSSSSVGSDASPRHSYKSLEPIILNRRSPSVHSRQSISATPPPHAPRRIFTPPPVASSIASAMEGNQYQPESVDRPSYLSYLAPFTVTPRKRMHAESMITVEETTLDQPFSYKRIQSPKIDMERNREQISQREPITQSISRASVGRDHSVLDQANITQNNNRERLNNLDVEMVDINVNSEIPDNQQLLASPNVDNTPDDLSVHDLSISDDNKEDEQPNTAVSLSLPRSPKTKDDKFDSHIEPNSACTTSEDANRKSVEPGATFKDDEAKSVRSNSDIEPTADIRDQISESSPTHNNNNNNTSIGQQQQTSSKSIDKGKQVDRTIQEQPILYSFDDDNIDYGDVDGGDYEQEQNESEQIQATDNVENTANHVLRELRTMANSRTLRLKTASNYANVHIKTIGNLVLARMKEIRKLTADAHERSIIEDYYYTINDDLRKYLKNYLQYEQCSSASRRLANFYRKKEQDYLAVVKQESTLKRNIDNLKQELHKMDGELSNLTNIEDMFNDINQIKDSGTVTKSPL